MGERIWPLTKGRANPAVPVGGNFRIIDFVLSSFVNWGICSVYILTQYMARSLIGHLGQKSDRNAPHGIGDTNGNLFVRSLCSWNDGKRIQMDGTGQIILVCDICGGFSEGLSLGGLSFEGSMATPIHACPSCGPIDWEVMQICCETVVGSNLN